MRAEGPLAAAATRPPLRAGVLMVLNVIVIFVKLLFG
jgi:type IV secretory pathway VirB3-like protein